MKLLTVPSFFGVALTLLFYGCSNDKTDPSTLLCLDEIIFTTQIKPIIQQSCAISGCHVAGFPQGDYNSYDVLKEKANSGRLHLYVVELRSMPPIGSPRITEEQRHQINCWINQGARNN